MDRTAPLLLAIALAFAAPAFAAAPAGQGKYSADYVEANLVVGQMTQDDVIQRFGKPGQTEERIDSTAGRREIWVYTSYSERTRGNVGKPQGLLGRVSNVLPMHNNANYKLLETSSDLSRAQSKVNAAGEMVQGDSYYQN